jgi:putative transposase
MTATPSIELPVWMAEQLSQASPDLLRQMVQIFAEALMAADADAVCGAAYGQRSPDRRNIRNGYRWRGWDTRVGTIELAVPKLREGSYFPDWLLERRRRAESALVSVVATSYLLGVSARRMEKLVQTLGITGLSKSQVSEMAKDLDSQVEAFRTRPLDAGPYTFVAADALVLKVREAGRTVNVHALLATGVNADGYRLPRPDRPRPHRRQVRDLRRPSRPGRGDRRHTPRRRLAAMPHPLRGEPHVGNTEERLGLGESVTALGL